MEKRSWFGSQLTRRGLLAGSTLLLARAVWAGPHRQDTPDSSRSARPSDRASIDDLVAANRILADQGVLDGYGHVSLRHSQRAERYLLSRSLAPELVTSDDILEYDLDSATVDLRGRAQYLERFIHGEIYRMRADVKAIVHQHSPAIIPFGVTTVPLQPMYHMAAFIGEGIPVFEIRAQAAGGDMLIRNQALGHALATVLGNKPAVLMRGHGAVVVGASLPAAVGRSVYLEINARLQAQAMALGGKIRYLSPEEARNATPPDNYERAWELWKRKALSR